MSHNVMVSVCCLVYNHEKYLTKCLESLVNQQVDFSYEVIVHDDRSTDNSLSIIREYETNYPNIIKLIEQKENQYQKIGLPAIYRTFLYPLSLGKYIAYCEGDDFWSDPLKLQKQVDILEKHPDCHMCCHHVQAVNEDGSIRKAEGYPQLPLDSGELSPCEFMKGLTDGYFFHTTSFLCRRTDILKFINPPPQFYLESDLDDVPLLLFFGDLGKNYYIDETMSCYRRNSDGSWTEEQKGNLKKIISHKKRMIRLYQEYEVYTKGKYSKLTEHWINNETFMIAEHTHDFKEMSKKKYHEFLQKRNLKFRILIRIASILPSNFFLVNCDDL